MNVQYTRLSPIELFEGTLTNHCYPWHFHRCYTVVMIDEGSMRYVFHDGELAIEKHQAFIVNPYESHYNHTAGDTSCSYRVLFMPVEMLNSGDEQTGVVYYSRQINSSLYNAADKLYQQIKACANARFHNQFAPALVLQLFSQLPCSLRVMLVDKRIEPAIRHIDTHLAEKLSIEELAALCDLSHYHFQRLFKKSVGLTVKAYVSQSRMELGRELLRNGITPVATSLETGHFDQSHFHKQFKKMWVISPAGMRA